jgi:uncharacterized protein YjbI with pentapeptide repeats
VSEQDGRQADVQQRPATNDQDEWKAYWKAQRQSWRTEPEIDAERQVFLTKRRSITPDIEQGIYPFKDIKLSRADVEWLLATHEHGRGAVDWNDESQREREGLDLRGADLRQENLSGLPLAQMRGGLTYEEWKPLEGEQTEEQINMAAVQLQGANLREAQMQEAILRGAQLQGAILIGAQLQEAYLFKAQLQRADLYEAQLQEAYLIEANLSRADLGYAQMQGANLREAQIERVFLNDATLSDERHGTVLLADIQWGEVNLAVIDWGQVKVLGDEQAAQEEKDSKGKRKDKQTRLNEYKVAVRANRQLAVVLRNQGLNDEADHFAYRAQVLQRRVFWLQMSVQQVKFRQRAQSLGRWLFSWFLNVGAGYGYKPLRCFIIYLLALLVFTLAHYLVGAIDGHSLTFLNALAVSVQSLHGRLFSFQTSDPQTVLNTIEAFVGLFIEAIVVAVITQRILGK